MKSSPRIINAYRSQVEPVAWQPEDLEDQPLSLQDFDLAAILEVFRQAGRDLENGSSDQSVDTTASWMPDELSAEELFEEPHQEFIDLQKDPQANTPVVIDPVAAAEEEAQQILAQARSQAEAMLQEAQQSASEMIAATRQDIENEKQQAREQGLAEANAELQTCIEAVKVIPAQVEAWKEKILAQSAPLIIEMLKEIAQKIFGEGVELNNKAIQQNLNRVMENVKSVGDMSIFLNPRDAEQLDSAWREMSSSMIGNRIRIIPSETITRGGCYIQGQLGSLDARVESQLQVVMEALSSVKANEEGQS